MSCRPGEPCAEHIKRRNALGVLFLMGILFAVLSFFSFMGDRKQVTPDTIKFGDYNAIDGRRVFQAYNCMGCHTIVGNGGYFGPDLTKIYQRTGPAWLTAFLPSAGAWPTSGSVRTQLLDPVQKAEAGADSLEAYFKKYPGAAERVERRGGHASLMPNLPLKSDEIGHLVAFFKYTSAMNNEGWPPKPQVDGLTFPHARPMKVAATTSEAPAANASAAAVASSAPADPAVLGAKLAQDTGCMSCHASDKKKLVGPGWGGLYGSQETLADGSKVKVDDAYLIESIVKPNAKVVTGYPAGVMPSYETMLAADQVSAIVAYIHSLQEEQR
jgi:mono/diheme cytochrome c family protein